MNARAYAHQLVTSTTLAAKLVPPPADLELVDAEAPLRLPAPGRPC